MVSTSLQSSSTQIGFGLGFINKEQCDNTGAPPHTPLTWLELIFTCSLDRNKASKGRYFCDASDIIKNATEELKRLSQNGFQESFQKLYSPWQKCIVAQEEYFDGHVA